MPTLLDDVLETHDGPEPKVLTEDVQAVLKGAISTGDEDRAGAAVTVIAEAADVSTRTVYRVLNPDEKRHAISLDLADRLCLAAGTSLAYTCRLVWPDGSITPYNVVAPDNVG